MGSLQVSNGGVLWGFSGKGNIAISLYNKLLSENANAIMLYCAPAPMHAQTRTTLAPPPLAGEEPRSARDYRYYSCDDHRALM